MNVEAKKTEELKNKTLLLNNQLDNYFKRVNIS
jgi:hypothetical protein